VSGSSDSTNAPLGSYACGPIPFSSPRTVAGASFEKDQLNSVLAPRYNVNYDSHSRVFGSLKSIHLRCVSIALQVRSFDPQQMVCPVLVPNLFVFIVAMARDNRGRMQRAMHQHLRPTE
jgi:hypothetical protein